MEADDWMTVLKYHDHKRIMAAWRDYQKTGPRTQSGALRKPDAGSICVRADKMRKEEREAIEARKPQMIEAPKLTPEQIEAKKMADFERAVARERLAKETAKVVDRMRRKSAIVGNLHPDKWGEAIEKARFASPQDETDAEMKARFKANPVKPRPETLAALGQEQKEGKI